MRDMHALRQFLPWQAELFLFAISAAVAIKLLTGAINMHGLLYGRRRGGERYFSPERVQLLLVTITAAAAYLVRFLEGDRCSLPPVDAEWLAVLGGSHSVYLGGKAYAMLFRAIRTGIPGART